LVLLQQLKSQSRVVVDTVDDNFYAVDLEFGGLHAASEDVCESKVEERWDIFVDMATAVQQDRLDEFTSADTISFAESITSHNLYIDSISRYLLGTRLQSVHRSQTYGINDIKHHSLNLLIGNKHVLTIRDVVV
jgi:hypothetical protein